MAAISDVTQRTTRVVLARHAQASYPADGERGDRGGTLTTLGRTQARALGESLRPRGVTAIFCSELSRARQTAGIVAGLLDLELQVRPGLAEYEVGEEQRDAVDAERLEATLVSWLGGDLRARIPGGETGNQVARRMFAVLDDVVHRYAGETALGVSHGGAIIATLGRIAPGKTGLPAGTDGRLREQDIPGGTAFMLEHRPHGWRLLPRTS